MIQRICITGTGRSGSTFLIRILSLYGLDTGFSRNDILQKKYIHKNCNSGLEFLSDCKGQKNIPKIIKTPAFILNPQKYIQKYNISHIILPIRKLSEAAKSRVKNGKRNGGLWNATDEKSQILMYQINMSKLWEHIANTDIRCSILSFDKMISDPQYLYSKISGIFNLEKQKFLQCYKEAENIR